ncbi:MULTISPECIES: chorismate synthase [Terrabacteria group]|uniref:chorismate synthase n=1 Tax=Bacillati TaxID=1783272 RepID=UPI001C6F007B|nr:MULTISPECIES: chorismate synthase [Terrabacteria group]MBW9212168.1 chorismate synthase [Trueperella sp. zg.1013]
MSNHIGEIIRLTVFGESHGTKLGGVLEGIPAGILLPLDYIQDKLKLRKAKSSISTARQEEDRPVFLSGIHHGYTEGTAISFVLENKNAQSKDYELNKPRPSHADYVAYEKYFGYMNMAGGNMFSGRLTAIFVVAGALCQKLLEDKGIYIGSHIEQLYNLQDRPFQVYKEDIQVLSQLDFPVLDSSISKSMQELILETKEEKNSLGGILETVVIGLPLGLGNPLFDGLESELSKSLFSIPAIKGISFGLGFDFTKYKGSEINDALYYDNGAVKTKTNHNGGINGGISNGMPLIFHTVVKPTSSIGLSQDTIDLANKKNTRLAIRGRHDPAIIHRARVVVDAMTAFVILNAYMKREQECLWHD